MNLLTNLKFGTVVSFSGESSICGPNNVVNNCVVWITVVNGDVLGNVDPWKYLTVKFANLYDFPVST